MMAKTATAIALAALTMLPGTAFAEDSCHAQTTFAIVAHGGALDERMEGTARLAAMKKALTKARASLAAGARSIDVVETVVKAFEDSGIFNAGRGAIADAAGIVETDAAIMDGNGLRAGGVASMTRIKNPIHAARLVMEANRHVLMVGDRGQAYVERLGATVVPKSYFIKTDKVERKAIPEHGTVGAVALDRCGHIAAATSTGGFDAKIPGRVGDSPLVGDGVYAADDAGGFSGTGHGEYYIRYNVSKDVADRMRYAHRSLDQAIKADIFDVLGPLKVEGGLIGVDVHGNVGMYWNTVGMFRGYATDREAPVVAEYQGPTHSKPRPKP
jgi:isoaspartyl peptidase/L-asparaginase-like protein (Ntn-hydrolase superfamily)